MKRSCSHPSACRPASLSKTLAEAWQTGNFARLYANSILIAVVSVIGIITISTTAAYGLARYHFTANRPLFLYFLVGMAVPTQALMVPSFKLMAILDSWTDCPASAYPPAQQPPRRHSLPT